MDGLLLDIPHLDPFQKWAIICAAALTIVYAVMRPLRKRKDPLAHGPSMSLAGQREVEKQMTELLVELEQMARKMTAHLDTRSARLETLIRDADERIATLRTLSASTPGALDSRLDPFPAEPGAPETRHADVYELANQGQSARQIAQTLSRPHGEIELILALRGRNRAPSVVEQA